MRIYIHQSAGDLQFILSDIHEKKLESNHLIISYNKAFIKNVEFFDKLNWFFFNPYSEKSWKIGKLIYAYFKIRRLNLDVKGKEIVFFGDETDYIIKIFISIYHKGEYFFCDLYKKERKYLTGAMPKIFNIGFAFVFNIDLLLAKKGANSQQILLNPKA